MRPACHDLHFEKRENPPASQGRDTNSRRTPSRRLRRHLVRIVECLPMLSVMSPAAAASCRGPAQGMLCALSFWNARSGGRESSHPLRQSVSRGPFCPGDERYRGCAPPAPESF